MARVRVHAHSMGAVQNDCRLWARSIASDYSPDLVVFPAKSGFLFAEPIADELGVPMVDVFASRPGNGVKDGIRDRVPWVPRWLLALVLGSKAMYGYNESDAKRNVALTPRSEVVEWGNVRRVLVVDDSVDTGWSVLAVRGLIEALAPNAEVRIAGYCVVEVSERRVTVDWWRYRNAIVLTATSRFSREHQSFLDGYATWCEGLLRNGR